MAMNFNTQINNSIFNLFKCGLDVCIKNPLMTKFAYDTLKNQKSASRLREKYEMEGVHVPPFMIISITNKCNLNCSGCYAKKTMKKIQSEINRDKLYDLVSQAGNLGISIILLAGGEPLLRKEEIFSIAGDFKNIIFPLFTNGMLLSEEDILQIKKCKNIIPIISLEGDFNSTDDRRGFGVYYNAIEKFRLMKKNSIFYGTSITVTKENLDFVTNDAFVDELLKENVKLFFYVEYVPVDEKSHELALSSEDRKKFQEKIDFQHRKKKGIFISFPGDEEKFGGCISSGRGFIHVSPSGDIEPCPFAPFSDSNINNMSLKEGLKSNLLKTVRENHNMLVETKGGCALWNNRSWLKNVAGT